MKRHLLWLVVWLLLVGCGTEEGGNAGNILYRDAFAVGETGPWLTEGDISGMTAIENERLVITINSPSTLQFVTLQNEIFDDFSLEVDAMLLDGAVGNSYGVLFRMQPGGAAFYRFEITGSGMFVLERRNGDGSWTRLTDGWQTSPAIQQGSNVINRLKVVAGGPNIILFANGQPLGQFSDPTGLYAGEVGLDAGTFGQTIKVSFDNVLIQTP